MKAVQIKKYGSIEVMELVDVEKPRPGRGQVLVQVHASCVNPFDSKIREGAVRVIFPFTLGSDMAGVVAELGEGAQNFTVGEKVYGSGIVLAGATGAFAEFVATPENLVARMPGNIGFNEAAAAVLTGVSAAQALLEHINLQPGQKILIHGGAGGIGTVAIQIAKKIGAYVAATVTGDGLEYVKNLGADQIIDYKNQAFDELLFGYDAVLDTVGEQIYKKSFKVLKKGGIIVSMVMPVDKYLMDRYQVTAVSQKTSVTDDHLNLLTRFIEDGSVKIHIDKVFSLGQIKEAFRAKEEGIVQGKIVIEVRVA